MVPAQQNLQPGIQRSAARLASVQALYQMDIASTDINDILQEFTLYRFAQSEDIDNAVEPDTIFFKELLQGVMRRQIDIDPIVDEQLASGWRLVRINSILRAILRSALFELLERRDIPVKVIINEYIDVAHAFFDTEEPRVVNGILHNLAGQYRPDEMTKPPQSNA
ncbi:MAG: Transcription antitermination protein NusB [Hyphomicrobiaceae bacterium hypho_1]